MKKILLFIISSLIFTNPMFGQRPPRLIKFLNDIGNKNNNEYFLKIHIAGVNNDLKVPNGQSIISEIGSHDPIWSYNNILEVETVKIKNETVVESKKFSRDCWDKYIRDSKHLNEDITFRFKKGTFGYKFLVEYFNKNPKNRLPSKTITINAS